MSEKQLVRVIAPHFVAGFVTDGFMCTTECAPILKWAIGRNNEWLRRYFKRNGWKASYVKPHPTPPEGQSE